MWHLDANHDIAAALSLSSSFGRGNLALVLERGALSLKTHKVGRVLGFNRLIAHDGGRLQKIVVDCPRQLDVSQLQARFKKGTFDHVTQVSYVSSHWGTVTARRRTLLLGRKEGVSLPPSGMENYRVHPPPSMQLIPLEPETETKSVALEGRLTQEPRIVTTGDAWLPHPFGMSEARVFSTSA